MNNNFERGKGDWNKLANFLDNNYFTNLDMLAVICANLLREPPEKEYKTKLMIQGINLKLVLSRKCGIIIIQTKQKTNSKLSQTLYFTF